MNSTRRARLQTETLVVVALLAVLIVLVSALLHSTYFGVYVGSSIYVGSS